MKKIHIVILIIFLLILSGCEEAKSKFNITGEYICDSIYFDDDFFAEKPENVSKITFNNNGFCKLRVNYLGGISDVDCSYEVKQDFVKVKVHLEKSILSGTDERGNVYMNDEYIFSIINNNEIVIDKGFYAVKANDSFIKK